LRRFLIEIYIGKIAEIKIVVFGLGVMDKSAIILQFIRGTFMYDYDPTIEDKYQKM
jgi:GTPase SAR1 family protein